MPTPEFDFIIVGTGTGGGHAAARLVTAAGGLVPAGGFKVLSLEAGGDFWDYDSGTSENRAYVTQIAANDETLWDWDYRCEAEVTRYVGTWAGSILVTSSTNVAATMPILTINTTVLTPVFGAPGVDQYDVTDGTLADLTLIATRIANAINDPLNSFAAAGFRARASRGLVIVDRIPNAGPVLSILTASTAAATAAIISNGTVNGGGCTVAQATVRNTDQSMGRMVGGSGNHFGYLCYRPSLEDFDEWDYAIQKNTAAAVDGVGPLPAAAGPFAFAAGPGADMTVTGAGPAFTALLAVGDYVQVIDAPYPVGGTVPFRVKTILTTSSFVIELDATGKPFPGGPAAAMTKCSIWNRTRMLTQFINSENDVTYGPNGPVPKPTLHGSKPFPATELGYVGNDAIGDTRPSNSAPPATARVPVELDAMIRSLTGSALTGVGPVAGAPAPMPAVAFYYTFDRNGENNWGDTIANSGTGPAANITGVDPWSCHKIPVNEIGFDSSAPPPGAGSAVGVIAGGMQTGGLFHLNKYSERRSQLIVAIDPIRSAPNYTLRTDCVVDRVILQDDGGGLRAVGVEYYRRDEEGGAWSKQIVYGANIVVAASAIGSPAILLRSGIGAVDRLAPGIAQVLDLPGVGADVINHQSAGAGSGATFNIPPGTIHVIAAAPGAAGATISIPSLGLTLTAVNGAAVPGTDTFQRDAGSAILVAASIAEAIRTSPTWGPAGVTQGYVVGSTWVTITRPENLELITTTFAPGDLTVQVSAGNNILLSGVFYAGLYKSSWTMSEARARDFSVGGNAVPALPAVLFDQGPEARFNLGAGTGNEATPISSNAFGLAIKQGTRNYGRTVSVGSNQFKNRSKGDGVRLRSVSPFDPPEFRDGRLENPNAFEAECFLELSTVEAAKLADATVVGGLVATYGPQGLSAASQQYPVTPAKIGTIHAGVSSSLHAVSTVKIGPPSETTSGFRSCLDQYGRMYGVKGLAVCDNSVHPTITRGNPHLPTIGVAENMTAVWIARGGLDF